MERPVISRYAWRQQRGNLLVEIIDDGRGLPENPNPKGMGLRILKYRTDSIGASLTVHNLSDRGVKIVLTLPHTGNCHET